MPLKRALGSVSLTLYAVGMILGAGIYSVLGEAAGQAGTALWLGFAIAAAAALLTGLSYAELTTALPKAGAEVVYLRKTWPRQTWLPLIFGVVLVLSEAATATTVSVAFAGYLQELTDVSPTLAKVLFLAVITAVNIVGIKQSSWMNAAFTVIEVSGLVLVVFLGLRDPDFGRDALANVSPKVFSAAALVFFAYLGFEEIANLAEETKRPEVAVPRAILVAVAATTVLYVLVALASVALLPPVELQKSQAPLAAAVAVVSQRWSGVLGGVALFATANTGLVAVIVTSRLLYGMAKGGDLPPVIAKVLPGRQTPYVAALIVLGLALALLPFGGVASIASLSSFGALLGFFTVNLCVIVLRYREPGLKRPFRVPLAVGAFPVLPALGMLVTFGLATQFDRQVYFAGLAAFAAAVLIWLTRRLWASNV